MVNVHLRIADSATKRPLPVRLRIDGDDGTYYPPLGRAAFFPIGPGEAMGGQVRLAGENFAYIDGQCEVPLPAGVPLRIRAWHGPEWTPLDRTMTLGAGQLSLRFDMDRAIDRGARGWKCLDLRTHELGPFEAWLEARAEDMDAVQLLARPGTMLAADGHSYATAKNLLAFGGATSILDRDGTAVFANTLNIHPVLGSLALLQTHRPIFPLGFGGSDDTDDWSLSDWAAQAHRKRGLVVWCDPFRDPLHCGGEALIAAVHGDVDAIECDPLPRRVPFLPWLYRLWNAGVKLALVGSSAKCSNGSAIGALRTYAAGPDWVESIRTGRCFASNGPLLHCEVNGRTAAASAESLVPFERLELIADGRVLAAVMPTNDGGVDRAEIAGVAVPDSASWVTARCQSDRPGWLNPTQPVFAHASAIFLGTAASSVPDRTAIAGAIERTRDWIAHEGRFAKPIRQQQHLDRCDAALQSISREESD